MLFATIPWKTHFYPMVPLAWALRSAGHDVRVASEPEFLDTITEAGLTAVPVGSGETVEERIRRIRGEDVSGAPAAPFSKNSLYELGKAPRQSLSWEEISWIYNHVVVPQTWLLNDEMVDDLVTYCRSWQPDLVLCDVLTCSGAVAADVVGAAHGRLLFWFDLTLRMRQDFLRAQERQPPGDRADMLRDWFAEWTRKYGRDFGEELITGDFEINVMPERYRLQPHEQTLSQRYVQYNGRSVVPSWLCEAPRSPRVLVTFGLSSRQWEPEMPTVSEKQVQDILDSLADLDIELVLTLSSEERERIHRIPRNTRVVDFVPLDIIVPTCSAVVHHGGTGSFHGPLVHGVPQIVIECSVDAPAKRTVLREAGAGMSIAPDEVTGPRVKECLTRLLEDNAFRVGAERLRQEALAQPTPNALVAELERVTAEHRARR
ncbi:activator-dependent family glycosyltransferase [Streptomyces lancefieldiae]|uniref:Activator-dependent family glycosyltransferase n=1 Tax=Streptomyces lancefieldiae TaxID=3075520 RepID=A0ABU3B398_9ACTN|nr:activator-dependent family glycosyltransferase [Streptomyces sp. DSM 40712]MDT0616520.1 activator-dependent family glycosyltransferase [Streptomyces sp. DSM 40712]